MRSAHDSVFGPGGAPRGQFQTGDYIDMSVVTWPGLDGYDYQHAQNTGKLARFLAENIGLDPVTVRIVEAAATLHDIGRVKLGEDPNHYARGAELAQKVLTSGSNASSWNEDQRNEVSRLIMKHGDRNEARGDKRLQVIQDADRLEFVRFNVGKKEQLGRIAEVCRRPDLYWTQYCSTDFALKAWMKFRGWLV